MADLQPLDHIARLIEAQGRRMDWLAERTGISQGYLSHILAGRRRLRSEHAQRIADALQVPVEYIRQSPEPEPQEAGV